MSKPIKIKDIKELKCLASHEVGIDCFITLGREMIRSSKHIKYNEINKHFYILNEIDDTEQTLNEAELMDEDLTNIGKALKLGALYEYNYNH